MSMLRKIQRVGKRATKFQYTATYQSVVVESLRDKWRPNKICVSWTRKGRRLITKQRPWQQSPDNNARGVVIWPEPEIMDITVTLYKGPKDKSYETKEWEFAVIDVDNSGKRKVLATTSINMVRYASSMPYDHDLHLRLKPTSRKVKTVMLEVSLNSKFLKEGKATDDDMISLASMMSVSNLSTIGFLEDEDDDYYWTGGRSITPPMVPQEVLSTDQLLKWCQEVTENVPSVKITNMTTSWRSGIGFLAIIHYHRPDLVPDFDMLSPNTLKENNILAFEIARSLGIACTLTPNMMVTATVPDKLGVTSFVYQMYQYFNKATQSAITRQGSRPVGSGTNSPTEESKKSPSSPFDISKFDELLLRNSPVSTPPADVGKVNMYSRHSRDESQAQNAESPTDQERTSRSVSPAPVAEVIQEKNDSKPDADNQLSPTSIGGDEEESGERVSPRTSAKLRLDELVSEHAHLISGIEEQPAPVVSDDRDRDRALEFENPLDTDESSSEPPTNSTTSLLDDEDSRSVPELPLDDTPTKEQQSQSPQRSSGRKLPTVPTEAVVSVEDQKREERRKRAKEMLRKHRIDVLKMPSTLPSAPASTEAKDSKYRQQAIDMLGKVFGTPETARRTLKPRSDDDDLTSGDSSTSIGPSDGGSRRTSRPRSATVASSSGMQRRSTNSDSNLTNVRVTRTEKRKEVKSEVAPPTRRTRAQSFDGGSFEEAKSDDNTTHSSTSEGRPKSIDLRTSLAQRRLSDGQLEAKVSTVSQNSQTGVEVHKQANGSTQREGSASKVSAKSDTGRTTSRADSGANRQRKRPTKALPAPRPVSSKPSIALQNLAEQKKKESELKIAEQAKNDSSNTNSNIKDLHLQNGNVGNEATTDGPSDSVVNSSSGPAVKDESPSKKKTLPSPAWSEHDDELSKDILVTQSEYVKEELIRLRHSLQQLEDRAENIETDIRNAMSEGDREQEENLMQEWFSILNKKNELIKRQMELNFIEKEEDLEKRQFFLNRELRPLMEIPEDDKTPVQKDREAHLLRELLELIDERDKLERKRMSTERITRHERSGLAAAQAEAPNIVQGTAGNTSGQSSKECIIQ